MLEVFLAEYCVLGYSRNKAVVAFLVEEELVKFEIFKVEGTDPIKATSHCFGREGGARTLSDTVGLSY